MSDSTRIRTFALAGVLFSAHGRHGKRYAAAYRLELANVIDTLTGRAAPLTSAQDALMALVLAEAALESAHSGRTVAF